MSITFYGKKSDEKPIFLDIEDAAYLNMANGNGHSFLTFLRIDPGPDLYGEITMPEARRAIMYARATFERHVGDHTREGSDTKRPGQARIISAGLDPSYFARKLDAFEKFLDAVAEKGAISIYWA